jgi:F0F1-type ATP synthase membrane subunit b/b'
MEESIEDNIDITRHLLEVENEAGRMVAEAEKEGDSLIAAARAEAEGEFKTRYAEFIKGLESREEQARKDVIDGHDRMMNEYMQSLRSAKKDPVAFNSLLEKLLYA